MALVATIVAAALGMAAGYLAGCAIALHLAEGRLGQFAGRLIVSRDTSSTEARDVMAAMRASSYPFCSDADIFFIRNQVFSSEYMKDAGRIRDGKIVCSASLGRLEKPFELPKPEFSQADGTKVYQNLAPFPIGRGTVVSLQLGDVYAIFGSRIQQGSRFEQAEPLVDHLKITKVDHSGRSIATPLLTVDASRTKDGQGRHGDSVYATRCSPLYFSCVTAYATIPGALLASQAEVKINIVLGGLTGALLGFVFSLLYRRNRSMEQQLRRAVRKDRLRVAYQPIVSLSSGRIVGAEALMRWTDEDGVAVGPDMFIKIAEAQGFVGEITRLVVHHALRDFASTLRAHADFQLSVNVAAADLGDPGFLPMLDASLNQAGVAAASLAIEITESSTARFKAALVTIHLLRQRGHSVHIDDFGTGYSSLSYLHDLSIDAIKIDRSFTQAIGTEAVTVGILPQILAMAAALNLRVIVEGIETAQQASYFSGLVQPILGQGWLYGRPVPAEDFHRLLVEDLRKAPASADVVEGKSDSASADAA
ncbi:MAG: EAL domain-containing protein [Terracidiphilus sp.]